MAFSNLQFPDLGPLIIGQLRKEIEELRSGMSQDLSRRREAADTAFGELQAGAAVPQPEAGPAEGVQQLFGDIGSIISRRPEFGQRSREDIQARVAALRDQRTQNLQILRDKYAAAAQQLDKVDPIKALEYNEKVERVAKLLEQQHEFDKLGVQQEGEMKQIAARTAGDKEVAGIQGETARDVARINLQGDILRSMVQGKGDSTPAGRQKQIAEIMNIYKEKGTLPKKSRPTVARMLLGLGPADQQTEASWAQQYATLLMGLGYTERRGGKVVPSKEAIRMMREARIQHFGPEEPTVEGATTPPPGVPQGGAQVTAPRPPQEIIIETGTGRLEPRDAPIVDEVQRLFSELQAPSRGPMEEVIAQRKRVQLNNLIRQLLARGIRVNMPLPMVEGIDVEDFSDETLNAPAQ